MSFSSITLFPYFTKKKPFKVEIMMFTVGNIPTISDEERKIKTSDAFLQKVLVKTILMVIYFKLINPIFR